MPDQPLPRRNELVAVVAAITKTSRQIAEAESEMHERVLKSKEAIAESRELMARADRLLARRLDGHLLKGPHR